MTLVFWNLNYKKGEALKPGGNSEKLQKWPRLCSFADKITPGPHEEYSDRGGLQKHSLKNE